MQRHFMEDVIDENIRNHKYALLKIDLDPKEKEDNKQVYGAIWFDREAANKDILREECHNPLDEKMIVVIDDGIPDGSGFRFLFSVIGSNGMEHLPYEDSEFLIGSLYRVVGSMVTVPETGTGKIEFK